VVDSQGGRCPDPDRATDLAEFIGLLGELRTWAGQPSYRVLATRVGPFLRPPQAVSPSTIIDVFKAGRRRLNLDLVVAIVRALGLDEPTVARWRAACVRMHAHAKVGGSAGVLRQLPADLATFTGRDADVKLLLEAAPPTMDGRARTVVVSAIEGMAGVGKTQLALHAAHQLVRSGRYADAQLYVNLRGFDLERAPTDPAVVLDAFLRSLGVPGHDIPDGLDERAAMFRDRMHGKAALILLDNAADEEQVRDLIPTSPICLVLVTSRRSLAGLDGAVGYQLDVFSRADAVELLARIAGSDRVLAEPETAIDIVEACGLLPLAVGLAAARLRARPSWRLADLAGHLRDGGVDALSAGGRSLGRVFDMSFEALSQEGQRMFCLLGLHPGTDITAPAAAALADITPAAARVLLELLQDEHLLQQRIPGRYECHDLLRAYAVERADHDVPAEDRRNSVSRVLSWYLAAAGAVEQAVSIASRKPMIPAVEGTGYTARFDGSAQAIAWFEQEQANLIDAAEKASVLALPYVAWRLPAALSVFQNCQGNWLEAERLLHLGMDADEGSIGPAAEIWLLHELGICESEMGKVDESEAHLTRALQMSRQFGDSEGEVMTLGTLVWLHMRLGRPERGVECAQQALAIIGETGSGSSKCPVLNNLAACLHELDRPSEALEHLLTVLAITREDNDLRGRCIALRNIGFTYLELQRFVDAETVFNEAITAAREYGDRYYQAEYLSGVARSLQGQGRTAEALECFERSLSVFDTLDSAEAAKMRQRLSSSPLWFEA
jgi:tetratricopeptide (TPR) repeat protein